MTRRFIIAALFAALEVAGCSLRLGRKQDASLPPAPKPTAIAQPPQVAKAEPLSVPQTQVTLPEPQPISEEALKIKPEPPPPPQEKNAPPPRPRPALVVPPKPEPTPPATVQPPPTRQRVRPVQSASERRRLEATIVAREKQVQGMLARVRARQLSDEEKATADRIESFLEQSAAALRKNDLFEADALSSRALLLSQDLTGEK